MNDYTYSNAGFKHDNTEETKRNERAETEQRSRNRSNNNGRKRSSKTNNDSQDEAENNGFFARAYNAVTSKKMRAILGIILILFACYLTIAALSFLSHNAADQSELSQATEQLSANGTIENVAGPVGAKTSHHLFVEGLGLGSIVLIVYLVLLSLGLLGVKRVQFWSVTFKSAIFAITLSMIFGLFTLTSDATIPLGGYHGRFINIWLISRIGWVGAFIVSCLLAAILVTIYISELTRFYNKSRERIRAIQAKRVHERDREQYRDQAINEQLADGPLNVKVEETVPQPSTEQSETVVGEFKTPTETTFDDIENGNNPISDPDAVQQKGENKGVRTPETTSKSDEKSEENSPNTNTAETTADKENNNDPAFDVTAKEIEQASGENEAYKAQGPYDPRADLPRYRMPDLNLLISRPYKENSVDLDEQEENKERITKTLNNYDIQIVKIEATVGPTVTLYEIIPAEGVRIAKIKRLEDDIAMSLAALGIRIIAPIPGKGTIGIEVPNKDPQTVSIRSILGSRAFQECKYPLPMALGATISNDVYIADLTKMPHLLVAGATGQGKSVGLNTIIASLLYKRHPAELKFVLVDPKMVEFGLYARIEKHYLAKLPGEEDPVVTDPLKVVDTLNSLCVEMDSRYALLKDAECRSVIEYNDKFIHRRLNPERGHRYMPYIVMIVDEFADLIMMAGKSVETPIARIAQKARAVGMHMIIATQRPSTNVITGIIKANFPGRIAFRVTQMVDSRTILDAPGANQLIGRGDMLISTGGAAMTRVQCAFIDTPEVEALCHHIDDQIGYPTAYPLPDPPTEASDVPQGSLADRDVLFDEVARYVVQGSTASTSNIQRKYSVGYARAGKIMDQLEQAGIVGPTQGGKPRNVLIDPSQLEMILQSL